MTGTITSAQMVVEDYARAWTSGDVDTAMSLIADDIVCEAPAGKLEGLPAYRRFTEEFVAVLTGATITKVLGDGTSAAVVYTTDTKFAQGIQAMDYITVESGRIQHILTVFDRLPFSQAGRHEEN